jgi:hypothetical protein
MIFGEEEGGQKCNVTISPDVSLVAMSKQPFYSAYQELRRR